jgi:membrane protein required for colicin V production
MTWVDYAVITIVSLSVLVGILRGLVKELIALIGWVLAISLAMIFSGHVAELLTERLGPTASAVAAFLGIFVVVWMLSGLVGLVLSKVVKAAGLGWTDRVMGALFGMIRGAIVVVALAIVAGLTALPRTAAWQDALLSSGIEAIVNGVKPLLPLSVSEKVRFS